MSVCEKMIELNTQAECFETGAVRGEETLTVRVYWDGPGYELDVELIEYTVERRNGDVFKSHDFRSPLGLSMADWAADYWQRNRDYIENHDDDFMDYRAHAYHQHKADIARHHWMTL